MLLPFSTSSCLSTAMRRAFAGTLLSLTAATDAAASEPLQRAVEAVLEWQAASAVDAIDVYIGTDMDDLSVQSAQLRVGGETMTRIEVGGRAARAMHAGGMLRLRLHCRREANVCGGSAANADANAKPSTQATVPLEVEVMARRTDAAMSSMLVRLVYEAPSVADIGSQPLQLLLTQDGVLRRYVLQRRTGDPA